MVWLNLQFAKLTLSVDIFLSYINRRIHCFGTVLQTYTQEFVSVNFNMLLSSHNMREQCSSCKMTSRDAVFYLFYLYSQIQKIIFLSSCVRSIKAKNKKRQEEIISFKDFL